MCMIYSCETFEHESVFIKKHNVHLMSYCSTDFLQMRSLSYGDQVFENKPILCVCVCVSPTAVWTYSHLSAVLAMETHPYGLGY